MNTNITPTQQHEITQYIPEDWSHAADDWLTNYNSQRTRRAYLQAWRIFLNFCPKSPNTVTQSDIIAFKEHMTVSISDRTGKPVSQETINLRLSALSAFYTFAMERGLIDHNPVDGVKRKAVNPYGKATAMDTEHNEDKLFLAQINKNTVQGQRDFAMMLLMLTTGVRVSVLANAYIKDVQQRGSDWYLNYINKGGEDDSAKITPIMPVIRAYLESRGNIDGDAPLFTATELGQKTIRNTGNITALGQPLSARSIRNLVKKYAHRAGLANITPHSLRHTAAMRAAKKGTLSEVSKLLRHKNTRITTIYLDHIDKNSADKLTDELAMEYLG